jgi:nitrile hydratase
MGFAGLEGTYVEVNENTDQVHNLVVCTLCSCYPWAILGLPPTWYKSAPYRSRVVKDPRGVLEEFGVTLSEEVEVRVWDSTADFRYLVLPQRPTGTDNMTADQLAELVNRDSMIGTGLASLPDPG